MYMSPRTSERVAARHRLAAFVPDKLFKSYETELKRTFASPLKNVLEDVPMLIRDQVIPLHEKFVRELSDSVPQARETLEYRLGLRKALLEKVRDGYVNVRRALAAPYPQTTTLERVLAHIEWSAEEKLAKDFPTLGRAFKSEILIDAAKVKALASRALKQATPEERAAIDADENWSTSNLERKYGFFKDHVDVAARRLVKKQRIEVNWTGWFAFIREVLAAAYATKPRFSEFELNGMKVIIDDNTVTAEQQEQYVKYLDVSYRLLKKKKLGRAWYGSVYISCEQCGGVNHNTGGGVGGHYHIEKDHVRIFSRPSAFIVELMAHELGHRYWYKSLSSTQREQFKDLVKVRTRPKPKMDGYEPDILGPEVAREAMINVDAASDSVRAVVREFDKSRLRWFAKVIDKYEDPFSRAAMAFRDAIYTAVQTRATISSKAKAAWDDLDKAVTEAWKHLFNSRELSARVTKHPDGSDWNVVFKTEKAHWIAELADLLHVVRSTAEKYVTSCIEDHNARQRTLAEDVVREWQAEQDAIVKPVLPVSDYGGSNIDEAFAEVFAWYVLDRKLNADQEASFKAVLLRQDRTALKVASLWLGRVAGA